MKTYQSNGLIEQNGDELVLKLSLSIPYQTNFSNTSTNEKLAIYNGEFYREKSHEYRNDTLYVSYQKESISRENFYNILNEVSENLNDFSDNPSQKSNHKTSDFFKNLVKDYTSFARNSVAFFWIEDAPFGNYSYALSNYLVELSTASPPPQF